MPVQFGALDAPEAYAAWRRAAMNRDSGADVLRALRIRLEAPACALPGFGPRADRPEILSLDTCFDWGRDDPRPRDLMGRKIWPWPVAGSAGKQLSGAKGRKGEQAGGCLAIIVAASTSGGAERGAYARQEWCLMRYLRRRDTADRSRS